VYRLRAIGCAAVVNRQPRFYLEKRGARFTAASRQIASKLCSYRLIYSCFLSIHFFKQID
jgi:hypothetical protein